MFNSEPNKELTLTRSLASRGAGIEIAAGGAAAAKRGAGLVKHSLTIRAKGKCGEISRGMA